METSRKAAYPRPKTPVDVTALMSQDSGMLANLRSRNLVVDPVRSNSASCAESEVHWPALRILYSPPDSVYLRLVPNLEHMLPLGVDLTTVELLTFFPGRFKDPYFAYRCWSTRWTASALHAAFLAHHCQVSEAHPNKMTFSSNMQKSLNFISDGAHKTVDGISNIDVSTRLKIHTYSAEAFAAWLIPFDDDLHSGKLKYHTTDLRLSELEQHILNPLLPGDTGTLATLVGMWKKGDIEDLPMSQLKTYIDEQRMHAPLLQHNADMDEKRAEYWNRVAAAESKRKDKGEGKVDEDATVDDEIAQDY